MVDNPFSPSFINTMLKNKGAFVLNIACKQGLIVIRITDRIGWPPILSVIHTITIGTMLNLNGGNNARGIRNVTLTV